MKALGDWTPFFVWMTIWSNSPRFSAVPGLILQNVVVLVT